MPRCAARGNAARSRHYFNRALYEISKLDLKTFSMMIMNLARDLSRRHTPLDELAVSGFERYPKKKKKSIIEFK